MFKDFMLIITSLMLMLCFYMHSGVKEERDKLKTEVSTLQVSLAVEKAACTRAL